MSFIEIKSDELTVKINVFGAELWSVSDGKEEYIWQGDPLIWEDRAPVLFPITCNMLKPTYTLRGVEYPMNPHGFARASEFVVEELSVGAVTLSLKSSEETKRSYPYDFLFRVKYTLTGRRLDAEYEVTNLSGEEMYYSTGAHEGHTLRGAVENYSIIFDEAETVSRYEIKEDGLMGETPVPFLEGEREFTLSEDYFTVDGIILFDHKSRGLVLRDNRTGKERRVDFSGFDTLLMWRMPNAEYLCIEPWAGAPEKPWCNSDELSEKFRIRTLEAGGRESFTHSITF